MAGEVKISLTNSEKVFIVDAEDAPFAQGQDWSLSSYGYAVSNDRNRRLFHRLLVGAKPGEITDHINGNRLDNRRSNLRLCNTYQSAMNRGKPSKISTSLFKGVCYENGRWQSSIRHRDTNYKLGSYKTELEAACAYDAAALYLHGEFARTNFKRSENHPMHPKEISERSTRESWARLRKSGDGICFLKRDKVQENPWQAYVSVFGKRIHLGTFPTEDAAKCFRSEAIRMIDVGSIAEGMKPSEIRTCVKTNLNRRN